MCLSVFVMTVSTAKSAEPTEMPLGSRLAGVGHIILLDLNLGTRWRNLFTFHSRWAVVITQTDESVQS